MDIKPFQVIIMVVFGLTALVGLFLFANFQGFNSGVVPVGSVTIWGTLPGKPIQDALANLKQSHGELAKVTYTEKSLDTFDAELSDAIASGRGPDLIIISQEQLVAEQPKIKLITSSATSERAFRDAYLPEAELFLFGKGAFGIPFVIDPLMLYYNRTQLASVGVATAPSTWEAVAGLSPALTRTDAAGGISKSGVAFGTYQNIENARAILSLFLLQAGYSVSERTTDGFQGTLTRPVGQNFGTTPAVSAVGYYLQFANPAKTSYTWNAAINSARQAFVAGDLGLYFGFASEEPVISAANPNLDFDMAPVPSPATSETRMTYGRVYAFAIPKASANAAGAERVAMQFTSKEVVTMIAHSLRMAPAQRALLTPAQGDLYEPVYFPQALLARGWLSPAPAKTDSLLATMVASVTTGRQSITDAISTLDQALTAALR
ncbi:MAG: carbohydrate ABC transporter substrate-binding protein [Candidatus Pacebacteria bacterium]|nr:carbohydrate ABC transporter substrate-binding protein [Candidatus Paceibacterota bacterium]